MLEGNAYNDIDGSVKDYSILIANALEIIRINYTLMW